jgi:hypothetical protein
MASKCQNIEAERLPKVYVNATSHRLACHLLYFVNHGSNSLLRPLGNTLFREWSDLAAMTRESYGNRKVGRWQLGKNSNSCQSEGKEAKEQSGEPNQQIGYNSWEFA